MRIPVTVYETVTEKLTVDEIHDLRFWRGSNLVNKGGQLYLVSVVGES